MSENTHVNNYTNHYSNHGASQFINPQINNNGSGTIKFGPFPLLASQVRAARRILEVFELLISIIIIGITVSASSGMTNDLGLARIPGKLKYNIGVVRKYPLLVCHATNNTVITRRFSLCLLFLPSPSLTGRGLHGWDTILPQKKKAGFVLLSTLFWRVCG